ncbi:MAG: YdcH family protein [Alphaproteobacteria bacterium]|nr:YdcH family protein [Alphaproteobacteria bacterium]
MSLSARIESLKKRHEEIEQELHKEESRPAQDKTRISRLKKEKLSIKDEIETLSKNAA